MNADTMIWNVQCVSEDAAKEFGTLLDNYSKKSERECAFVHYVGKQQVYQSSVTTKAIIAFSGNLHWYCIYDSLCSNPRHSAAIGSY